MKKIYFVICLFCTIIYCMIGKSYALDLTNSYNINSSEGLCQEKKNNIEVNEDIIEDEIVSYSIIGEHKDYRYVKVRIDINYKDKGENNISMAFIESTFRFNSKYKSCRCLSTSHGGISSNKDYDIYMFARTKNNNIHEGESYCSIRLERNNRKIIMKRHIIHCDYNGNIRIV